MSWAFEQLGVDGVPVSRYDAEKGKFYGIAVPNPRHLLIENLDAAWVEVCGSVGSVINYDNDT